MVFHDAKVARNLAHLAPYHFPRPPLFRRRFSRLTEVYMTTFLFLAAVTALTCLGDYCIKLSTNHPSGLGSGLFWMGLVFYGLPAFGWFALMRAHSLASVAVFYSSATLILMAGLGWLVFHEPMGARQITGLALALGAVLVMSGQ